MAIAAPAPLQAVRRGVATLGITASERRRLVAMGAVVIGLLAFGTTLLALAAPRHFHAARGEAFGFGTGLLALTLGMRHAFDADHIAAIDNTTRKMMGEGRRPLSVGFFFSLGHSSVVLVLTVLLGLGLRGLGSALQDGHSKLHAVAGLVGTGISGGFLLLIALLNLVVLVSILRAFGDLRRGTHDEAELERRLHERGLMNRWLAPLAARIDQPWKMYPLGLLFGLGFDTATEVGLLVLSGTAVASGLPFWAILSLPLLFAGGMSLLDTIDGCFMNFAYGWAFSRPVRKVFYNLVITALSIGVAVVIGGIEIASLLGSELGVHGGVLGAAAGVDINQAGFVVLGLFVVTWAVALVAWRLGRFEERFATATEA